MNRTLNSPLTAPLQLLFLPGALGTRTFWEPLAGELRFEAQRTFIVYPGFDGVAADPSMTGFSDLVKAILARIDRPTAILAQSMGGVLAIEAAIQKPSLITHLVLVATSGGLDTSRLGAADWRESVRQQHPNLPDWFTTYQSDLTPKLGGITVPTLLIWGDHDPISPVAVGRELFSRFPNAAFHVIPGGEHDLARTHQHLIVPLIESHLKNRPAPINQRDAE